MRALSIIIWASLATMMLPQAASGAVGRYGDYQAPSGSICLNMVCMPIAGASLVTESVTEVFTPTSPTYGFYQTSGSYTADMGQCWYLYKSMELWQQAGSPSSYRHCVYVGSEIVHRRYKRWLFNDIPAADKDEIQAMQEAVYNETRIGGNLISTQSSVSEVRSQTVSTFCNFYKGSSADGSVALDRTPESIMQACLFTKRQRDVQQETATTTTQVAPPYIPSSARRCGAVSPGSSRVMVRSTRHSCSVARSVVARYAKSLKSPAGWSCTALVRDSGLRARCARRLPSKATARSAVYGIWVRR